MSNYTLTNKELSTLRGRLTRAKKKGPDAVIAECDRAISIFETKGYPDSWSDWERERHDALVAKHKSR